jgi:hypothetical protein
MDQLVPHRYAEVSNVANAWEANGGRRAGVSCLPPAMMRTARVLALSAHELDALDAAAAGTAGCFTIVTS